MKLNDDELPGLTAGPAPDAADEPRAEPVGGVKGAGVDEYRHRQLATWNDESPNARDD